MSLRFPTMVSVEELHENTATILAQTKGSDHPTAIRDGEQTSAVLMSVESYDKTEEKIRLLKRLAKGEREIASGEGFDLDDVLADADRLLSSHQT